MCLNFVVPDKPERRERNRRIWAEHFAQTQALPSGGAFSMPSKGESVPFVRVKSAVVTDPQHEFDVSVGALDPRKHAVVDPAPVATARPALFVPQEVSRNAKKHPVKKSVEKTSAPDGDNS